MRFIDRIDKNTAALLIHHIDVIPVRTAISRKDTEFKLPFSFRNRKYDFPGRDLSGKIQNIRFRFSAFPDRSHTDQLIIIKKLPFLSLKHMLFHLIQLPGSGFLIAFQRKFHFCTAFQTIQTPDGQTLPSQFPICIFQYAVGIACGKMAVVQDPDLHVPFSGFIQDHIHILPPFFPDKIRMWAAFHADSPDAALCNDFHIFPKDFFCFSMLPEKGENIISTLSCQQFSDFLIHNGYPPFFYSLLLYSSHGNTFYEIFLKERIDY